MATTLSDLREAVLRRLGDLEGAIWTSEEVDHYLLEAYDELARATRVFTDRAYLENIPSGFSYTAAWEVTFEYVLFDLGLANYTLADERRQLDEPNRIGPANHTSPFEATDDWLSDVQASTAISATADAPALVTEIERGTWDTRTMTALNGRVVEQRDTRYEITAGEVYGFLWRKDGVRTLRKVRVPSQQADTYTINGAWGVLRSPTDISTVSVTGTWGFPRRIPTMHPMGTESFGCPRRPYRDGKNVRIEFWRKGRALSTPTTIVELPDRYAQYLRDSAQARCLRRPSAGQDARLAAHYEERWQRGLARAQRRQTTVTQQRVRVLGGTARPSGMRPPRPKLPWNYGVLVR